jgi:hypothetical protein
MTRGVPRGCVGGQVGRGGRARACLQLRKRHVGGGEKSGTILLEFFHIKEFLKQLHLTKNCMFVRKIPIILIYSFRTYSFYRPEKML